MTTPHRMTVLASGSSGNATFIEADGFGLLVDCGLNPQELSHRLQLVGSSWQRVNAVLLTHTHSDHWNKYTLEQLRRLNVPLFAHPRQHDSLSQHSAYAPLQRAGLTHPLQPTETLTLGGLTVRSVRVPHDSDPTVAYRIDHTSPAGGWAVGLASDLGRVPDDLFALFAGVDVLALEFNHCVRMERASRRPRFLVDRVLGDFGHLSNHQAADAVRAFAAASGLQAVVQLHLSKDCNTAELANEAGRAALADVGSAAEVITASQWHPTKVIPLEDRPPRAARTVPTPQRSVQPHLPGLE